MANSDKTKIFPVLPVGEYKDIFLLVDFYIDIHVRGSAS